MGVRESISQHEFENGAESAAAYLENLLENDFFLSPRRVRIKLHHFLKQKYH